MTESNNTKQGQPDIGIPSTSDAALELARRAEGVTAAELQQHVVSKTIGPMVRSLKGGAARGLLVETAEKRNGHPIYKLGAGRPEAPKAPKAAKPAKAAAKKPAAKAGKPAAPAKAAAVVVPARVKAPARAAGAPKPKPRRNPNTARTALELAGRKSGVTATDLRTASGALTLGPMVRVLKAATARGELQKTGQQRNGEDVYVLGAGRPAAPKPAKAARPAAAPKPAKAPAPVARPAARAVAAARHDGAPSGFYAALGRALQVLGRELESMR